MILGKMELWCPICGQVLTVQGQPPWPWHSREFGWICGKVCHDKAELVYARMILGKESLIDDRREVN